jgi:hypothetical protein
MAPADVRYGRRVSGAIARYSFGVADHSGDASGDGLEFIEVATGMTVLAAKVDDGWMLESPDGTEKRVTTAEFEVNYRIRLGGDS